MLRAPLRHLALSFVLLASSASPAAAGPIEISPTEICVLLGAHFVGSGSKVVGVPACVAGLPTGLAGAAIGLPVAAVAGAVAAPWGKGGDVFGIVWGAGAGAGFGLGALAVGYPVNLVKFAVWDGPLNVRCSLTEHCWGARPDPGVDYRAKRRDVALNLPYTVYRPNLPVGFEMTEPTFRSGLSGTHDAIVESIVWRATAENTGRVPDGRHTWVKIHQMEDIGLVPAHCPGDYVSVEYGVGREFTASCSETGKLVDGNPLYRTETESGAWETFYAVRLGGTMRRTLVVVEFGSEFDEQQEVAELLPMLENMRIVPITDLLATLE